MKFLVAQLANSYAVAYRRPSGELCALSDHPSFASAQREADERNRAARTAELWAARRDKLIPNEWAPMFHTPRAGVRYFEPDQFA